MNFSPRLVRIFQILLEQEEDGRISADDMAERIRISRRTLFRELESARRVLEPYGVQLKTRPGLALAGNRTALAAALMNQPVQVLNREKRQDLLLYELLRAEEAQKLVVYAGRFQVSEATISHDLEDLRRRLEPLGLTITRNGVVQGSEEDRRKAMSGLVHEGVEYKTVDYLDPDTAMEQLFRGSAILSLLDQDILKRLLALLSANRDCLGLGRFEQNSYIGLVIHLVIALERIRAGEPCRDAMHGLPEMEDSRQEARTLISLLEAEFALEFPDTEVDAVALHLRGSKLNSAGNHPDAHQEEILELARCFIEGFPGEQAALLGTDGQFIQGLVSHLEPTVIRLRNGLPIYNPLLKTLREQYPDLFERTRQAAGAMERRLGMRLSDEEIGFLTMHAGACFERAGQQHGRGVKAAVVCASGIGVSALLCARLEKTFGAQMDLEALSAPEAVSRQDVELFLTTFDVQGLPTRTLKVSPLLPAADLRQIQTELAGLQAKPARGGVQAENLEDLLVQVEETARAVRMLQTGIVRIPTGTVYDPAVLIHEAARSLQGDTEILEQDLWRREQLGAVRAPEEGFALFHARTGGTARIQAAILLPAGGQYDNGLRGVLVTVLPADHTPPMQQLLAQVNRQMGQDAGFRQVLLSGPAQAAREATDRLLADFLRHGL